MDKAERSIRIHSHPIMERSCRIPEGHVIIDDDLYMELIRRFGDRLPEEGDYKIRTITGPKPQPPPSRIIHEGPFISFEFVNRIINKVKGWF